MKWVYRLERKFGRYYIPRLMLVIIVGQAMVFLASQLSPAIQLMNREVMMINHVGDIDRDLLKKDFSEWMAEYKTAWLRENKISQINLIEKFINEIVELGKE